MSEKNVLRKLRLEACGRAKDKGHELGRFKKRSDGWHQAQCWKCQKTAVIFPALDVGVHQVKGEALEDRCENEFQALTA